MNPCTTSKPQHVKPPAPCHAEPFASLKDRLREASGRRMKSPPDIKAPGSRTGNPLREPDPSAAPQDDKRSEAHDDRSSKPHADSRYRVIPLTRGKFAIVDAEDYDRLARHKWYASEYRGQYSAKRRQNGKIIMMHRVIVNAPPGLVCDHKNHNTLDNRKCNLRICTQAQNNYNRLPEYGGTSGYKGVSRQRNSHKWQTRIQHCGRSIHIGCYDYEADAAIAYDDMAIDLFGEFACLNFNHRPEIRLWIQATYLFEPTRNDLGAVPCHSEPSEPPSVILNVAKRSEESGQTMKSPPRSERELLSAHQILRSAQDDRRRSSG